MPEYDQLKQCYEYFDNNLKKWYESKSQSVNGFNLLQSMFNYDPKQRITAKDALKHAYFHIEEPSPIEKLVYCEIFLIVYYY